MSISRKTPVEPLDDSVREGAGARPISEAPVSDVERVQTPWPTTSDVAPARNPLRRTEPPTVIALGQEELLRLSAEIPLDQGSEEVARTLADAVREVVSPCAVGVHLNVGGEPRVVVSLSPEAEGTEVATHCAQGGPPRRMFPALSDEWIVPLPLAGHSLHVADAGPARRDPLRSRALAEVAERAALLLSSSLRAAARLEATRVDGAQLRALQARVIQSEKLASVGQIAAKVVHELNNPLTAIVTYATFLTKKLERAGHDEADLERLRRIGESADRILRFSRELMTYARPNEETQGPVAIHEVLGRAIVFCEHIVAEHGIQVVTDLDPDTPSIIGRRGQLTQVFVNLVTNACHAIQDAGRGDAGRIDITAGLTEAGDVRISIADNGHGISPENVVRIFDPFFTTKGEGRGTGLGLSIVRSIVEGHGGRVWVRSVQGAGTSFIVELKRASR